VGWQDRDWAKWTPEERSRFLGGGTAVVPGALLAVVVSLVSVVALAKPGGVSILHLGRQPGPPPAAHVVYGAGAPNGSGMNATCTTMAAPDGTWHCTAWTPLLSGQQWAPAQSLPAGSTCTVATVEQRNGRWICGTSA
jgi:hypothetical protein